MPIQNPENISLIETESEQEYLEKTRQHLLNFLELEGKQEAVLRERIKNSGGKARIIIHVYWERFGNENYNKQDFHEDYPAVKIVEEGFERLATLDSELPLIVFEEAKRHEQAQIQLANSARKKGLNPDSRKFPVYFVPTFNGYATPNMENRNPNRLKLLYEKSVDKNKAYDLNTENWRKFNAKLHELGVKEIIIGGMMLELYHPNPENPDGEWLQAEYPFGPELKEKLLAEGVDTAFLGQCLGSAIRELSYLQKDTQQPIKITISHLTNPVPRRTLIDLGVTVEDSDQTLISKPESAHDFTPNTKP